MSRSPIPVSHRPELDSFPVSSAPSSAGAVDEYSSKGLGIVGHSQSRYVPTNPDPPSAVELDHSNPTIVLQHQENRHDTADPQQSPISPPMFGSSNTPHRSIDGTVSPMTPATKWQTPYTPSHYGNEPPSSILRTIRHVPPSLPQGYSAVSLGSMADIYRAPGARPGTVGDSTENLQTNIYQGLSKSRGEGAPWEYLSAERALKDGVHNEET